MIITDGEPHGKYKGALEQSISEAKKLKRNGVTVFAVAVGDRKDDVAAFLAEIVTNEKDIVSVDFDGLKDIIPKLVAESCVEPGKNAFIC